MPNHLQKIAAFSPEAEKTTAHGVVLEHFLHAESQARKAAPHVRVARGNPDPDAARNRDHRRLRSSRTRCSASPSTSRSTRTRQPPPSSISMIPVLARCAGGEDAGCGALIDIGAGAGVISTGTRTGTASPPRRPWRACRRQVNSRLGATPCRRAIPQTVSPACKVSSTSRTFSS